MQFFPPDIFHLRVVISVDVELSDREGHYISIGILGISISFLSFKKYII